MELKDSKTKDNLRAAFQGESEANRRYLYFAQKADIEGANEVAQVFRSTAEGETGTFTSLVVSSQVDYHSVDGSYPSNFYQVFSGRGRSIFFLAHDDLVTFAADQGNNCQENDDSVCKGVVYVSRFHTIQS